MKRIAVGVVVAGLIGAFSVASTTPRADADPPVDLGQVYCIQPGDSAGRAFDRTECDTIGSGAGYQHSTLIPGNDQNPTATCLLVKCSVQPGEPEPHKFYCAGVGRSN